jgi:predicted nucleotidyltransferase
VKQTIENRLKNIDLISLLYAIEESSKSFSSVVDEENLEIDGIFIVGSVLTDDFNEKQSDLDIYIHIKNGYENSDGLRRHLMDENTGGLRIKNMIPPKFLTYDIIGVVENTNHIRSSNIYVSKDSGVNYNI